VITTFIHTVLLVLLMTLVQKAYNQPNLATTEYKEE